MPEIKIIQMICGMRLHSRCKHASNYQKSICKLKNMYINFEKITYIFNLADRSRGQAEHFLCNSYNIWV